MRGTTSRQGWSLGLAAACLLLSTAAIAQEGDEHAAHHPGAQGGAMADAGVMGAAPSPAAAGMSGMMDEMMEGEGEHGARRTPFVSQLLAAPSLSAEGRNRLMGEAQARVERGLAMAAEASAAARSEDPAARASAARRLREASDLFASGSAALAALDRGASPQPAAISWFRDQMSLGAPPHAAPIRWLGVSPPHFMLMFVLATVSAMLLGLQVARLRRVRKIVDAGGSTAPAPAPATATASPRQAAAVEPGAETLTPSNAAPPAGASLRKPRSWSGPLRVVQIVRETPTIQTFRLADPAADRLPFDFLPGQFLQVEVEPVDGKPSRRSYTIASSPTQRAYVELTVKREEQGVVSCFLHDKVAVGDLLKTTGPFGAFTFTGTDADSIVLIAGGVGITPMMSVLRYLTDTAWSGEIFFLYGARSTDEFVFREELERLERRFSNLHVMAAMRRSAGTVWLGPQGPLTRQMLLDAVPDIARRRIHMCGPPGMMAAMRRELAALGVPDAQLHTEAFGPASLPADAAELEVKAPPPAPSSPSVVAPPTPAVAAATITFSVAGVSAPLPAGQTVLEAAEGAGVEIPYACRSGECGVCVTRLISGEVTMAVETGLDPADKAKGYILACQAKSTGQPLVVEA
ncbi:MULTISPECIES: 2Fe-2S iron-sulfur cluster-binding protein [unclassified Caulobacter]|uniref:2Fe-2S iron-sulfur cluster-binding protein n=1 Tax=unclassified Caulobacter TaxID=2648921 RepID=UPI00078207AB|nr:MULTISPECIES: 2Fe-2S iron-sulfur cluster-binding protein [unclassified Caulobacter]PIB96205.1 flavodoxin [Caulobacter sp. X]